MHTVTADKAKRIRIPEAKPGQVFAYEASGDGTITLTPVKTIERKQRFPRGSLTKYITPERNRELEAIYRSCIQGPE